MKQMVPYDTYLKIVSEAAAVATIIQTEGWKILEQDLLEQAGRIEELLAQNRLKTVQETITTPEGTKTFTTTAESQVAEHAGQYKQIQHLFDTIHTIIEAPEKLKKMESEGAVTVQKAEEGTSVPEQPRPRRLSKVMQELATKIRSLATKEL